MPGVSRAVAVEDLARLGSDGFRRAEEHVRVEVALQCHLVADAAACLADVDGPVESDRIAADGGDLLQPQAAVLGEYDARDALAVALLLQAGHDALHIGQREFLIGRSRQRASPGVEDHHRLRAGIDLRVEVADHGVGGHREDLVQQVRTAVHHALDVAEVARALPFDHVAGQRVRAAGKADQRHGIVQRAADFRNGIHHVAEVLVGIGRGQVVDRPFLAQRTLEARPLAFGEVKAEAHRIGDGEDVGEQDGGVEIVAGQRLQGDLAGHGRRLAQVEEIAGPLARFAILGKVTPGLAHQPEGGVLGGFLQQCAEEGVVAGSAHGGLRQK